MLPGLAELRFRCTDAPFEGRSLVAMRKIIRGRDKVRLYFGTVKSATGGRHFMAWANSREHALSLVEAALTATEPVQGSVVGPLLSLRADVMKAGVYVETRPVPKTP
jgi:formylmethanofuran:tetrahydromethanopterin formyltransferase